MNNDELVSLNQQLIAGVDEAGRGPLAGPVVAAVVILDPANPIEGLQDSKQLSEKRRDVLFDIIQTHALDYGVAIVSPDIIDRINILQATLLAMKQAVDQLKVSPVAVWVDGNQAPTIPAHTVHTLVKGDQKLAAISAASVLAKVTRDGLMCSYCDQYPGYGFAQHKGYGTAMHREAIARLGPCEIHRRSFSPVKEMVSLADIR